MANAKGSRGRHAPLPAVRTRLPRPSRPCSLKVGRGERQGFAGPTRTEMESQTRHSSHHAGPTAYAVGLGQKHQRHSPVQARGREAWDTPRHPIRRRRPVEPDRAKHAARVTSPVPRLTPLGFHGHKTHRIESNRRVTSEGLPMPRETASVASGARMAERSQCRASQRAWMPDASVRRRGVGNPEACHPHKRPQAGDDAGTAATARLPACGQSRSVPPLKRPQAPPSAPKRPQAGADADRANYATRVTTPVPRLTPLGFHGAPTTATLLRHGRGGIAPCGRAYAHSRRDGAR